MGFQKVYKCLMQLFPQVDSRILKAVAIENSKDVDAAAEIVLSEILPYIPKQTVAARSSSQKRSPRVRPDRVVEEEDSNQLRLQKVLLVKTVCSPKDPLSEADEVLRDVFTGAATGVGSVEASSAASTSKFHEKNNDEPADAETDELILLGNTEKGAEIRNAKSSASLSALGVDNPQPYNLEIKGSGSSSKDQTVVIEDGVVSTPHASPDTADGSTSLLVNTGSSVHSESDDHSTVSEKQERGSIELKFQQDPITDMGDTFTPVVSRSSQTCRIDLLEGVIEDAKNNKKTLFQAMQSIMDLMREVELQEEAAELAKQECAKGGLDILVEVEEFKQMLAFAKEANDKNAGEIFGEKAILVTEVRELQSRLRNLSEERDKSLSILDEMRQTLEAQQAAAKELMKAAEQEKLEKEESALSALAEQEAIMSKVVQESEILHQVAVENNKLIEYLMNRGQIVDSLQEEISVICQDVRLLKEKFDQCIPLSKSTPSSQTSCIMASSASSLKGMASDLGPEQAETDKTLEKRSTTPSADLQSPKSGSSEEWYKADDKELIDEGWELFDDAEINIAR